MRVVNFFLAFTFLQWAFLIAPSHAWNDVLREISKEEASRKKQDMPQKIASALDALAYVGSLDLDPVSVNDPRFETFHPVSGSKLLSIFSAVRTGDSNVGQELGIVSLIELFARVDTSQFSRRTPSYQRALEIWAPTEGFPAREITARGETADLLLSFLEVLLLYREGAQNTPYPRETSTFNTQNEIGKFVHLILPRVLHKLAGKIFLAMANDSPSITLSRRDLHAPLPRMQIEVTHSIADLKAEEAIDQIVGSQLLIHTFKQLFLSVEEAIVGERGEVLEDIWTQYELAESAFTDLVRERHPKLLKEAKARLTPFEERLKNPLPGTLFRGQGTLSFGAGAGIGFGFGLFFAIISPKVPFWFSAFTAALFGLAGWFMYFLHSISDDAAMATSDYNQRVRELEEERERIKHEVSTARLELLLLNGENCDLGAALSFNHPKELQ